MTEFIYKDDHYVYHITDKKNIDSIISHGLVPSLGDRSLKVGDNFKAIYFFDKIDSINDFMNFLYENKNKDSLEVLRFNIKQLTWFYHSDNEYYIKCDIPVDKLDYLELYIDNNKISFSYLEDKDMYNLDYKWCKLTEYHKIINT